MKSGTIAAGVVLITGVVLGLAPFVVGAVRDGGRPQVADVEAVAAHVRNEFIAGDCAVVRPAWFAWPLSRLRNLGPGTESWPFPALIGSEDLEPVTLGDCERVWWLSFFGADHGPAPLLDVDVAGTTERVVAGLRDGAQARLHLYDIKRTERLRSLGKEIASASVFRGARGSEGVHCRWRSDKHRCQSDGWLDVGLESRHVAHHEVHWVFAHPGRAEDELRIVWDATPAAGPSPSNVVLVVRAGFSMEAVRRLDGSDVRLEVDVDGVIKDTIVLEPHRWVLHRRAWDLSTSGAWPKVTFRVTADQPGWRELMLEADFVERMNDSTRAWLDAGPTSKKP